MGRGAAYIHTHIHIHTHTSLPFIPVYPLCVSGTVVVHVVWLCVCACMLGGVMLVAWQGRGGEGMVGEERRGEAGGGGVVKHRSMLCTSSHTLMAETHYMFSVPPLADLCGASVCLYVCWGCCVSCTLYPLLSTPSSYPHTYTYTYTYIHTLLHSHTRSHSLPLSC